MSTAVLCPRCCTFDDFLDSIGAEPPKPTHCYGEGDTPGIDGLIGSGTFCPCECRTWPHKPHELYDLAAKAHPGDVEAIRDHYRALMIEHGHIVKREPGQSVNLACGWPHRPEPDDAAALDLGEKK